MRLLFYEKAVNFMESKYKPSISNENVMNNEMLEHCNVF